MKTRDRGADTAVSSSVDTDWLLAALARMWDIRLFEEGMHRLFLKGEIHGTTHLSAGQEAVPVGICAALRDEDWAAGTYRGHGHALAKGTGLEPLAAEMLGREGGICGGRAGSMNVIDREHRLVGCFGIVGGSAAAAIGAGLAAKREGALSVAFFGDGAANHGYIHESVNFAKVHSLPVVFVCENNLYGEFTPMSAVTAGGDISARIATYGMSAVKVDGNDVVAVREAAETAAARARANSEPTFLECLTYRHYGHSKSDPGAYRTKEEVANWKERDPLIVAADRLVAEGVARASVDEVEATGRERVDAALARALESPFPDPVVDAATEFAA